MMKVLNIIEPWATLIKEKKKYIETRTWKTSYSGELYIHASKKKININDEHITDLLDLIPNVEMGYGKIICKCKLVDCIYILMKILRKKYLKISKNIYVEILILEDMLGF